MYVPVSEYTRGNPLYNATKERINAPITIVAPSDIEPCFLIIL
jgi:hypothetical protein